MAMKPVIVIVDDDPSVLAAVTRDLQLHYGEQYRIVRADSGATALESLRTLKLRSEPVALLIVDQRMPGMTGVELLGEAILLYPDVKRVLLTAYADTEVAIKAINDIGLDHYLLKPWDPPEEKLFPVIDDVLEDWLAGYYPPFQGVRVIGPRWSAETFALKDFLARNLVPYRWLDIERDAEASDLLEQVGLTARQLPVVILPSGESLVQPSQMALAGAVGLGTSATQPFYDLVIIGAGPSGLAGAVYGASEGLRTLLIERQAPGGQAGTSSRIENYLGFPTGLSGSDLTRRAVTQAKRLGAEILSGDVVGIRTDGSYKLIQLADGTEIASHAILIATGVAYRRLDAPGIERLSGAGVYYGGALSEAIATKGERVFIVGGSNSAGQAAIHFATYADCVTMLVRGTDLAKSGMSQYLIDRIASTPNIQVWYGTNIVEAIGDANLTALKISEKRGDETREIVVPADDLFIFIGAQPTTGWLDGLVALDPAGFILTGSELNLARNGAPRWPLERQPFLLETNVPGIFGAGDIRHQSVKRIASATGEGAMAIQFVHRYLSSL
jgi:thioredoxin reductase (NADPH)